ncbi:hypothetical protein BKA70DRAFT_6160 [Coprinopsis sp. MPI-PUGE-AT-0042]|nr:hypothetical protein BKA70DRAFT_6160 [Coprinopsis sp. MPI-PUGE-AT-0042]
MLDLDSDITSSSMMSKAAIHSLPVEVVAIILSDVIESRLGEIREARPFHYHPTNDEAVIYLQLSAVCRRWRDVVFSLATLWTSFCSSFSRVAPESMANKVEDAVQKLTQWYGRSKQLPLNIRLSMPDTYDLSHLRALNEYIVTINRWNSLEYIADAPLITSLLDMANLQLERPPFANLQHLTLIQLSHTRCETLGPLPTFSQTFPSLTELVIRLEFNDPSGFLPQLRFPHLTSLRLSIKGTIYYNKPINQHIIPVVLAQNPALQFLHLGFRQQLAQVPPAKSVTHTYLRTLEVEDTMIEQFTMLTLPGLTSLIMTSGYLSGREAVRMRRGDAVVQSIVDLIERSNCPLATFSTLAIRFSNAALVRLLSSTPMLKTLRLAYWDYRNGDSEDPVDEDFEGDFEPDALPKPGHFLTELHNRSRPTAGGTTSTTARILPCLQSIELNSHREQWTNARLNALLAFVHDPRRIWNIGRFRFVQVADHEVDGYDDEVDDESQESLAYRSGQKVDDCDGFDGGERYSMLDRVVLVNSGNRRLGGQYYRAKGHWWIHYPHHRCARAAEVV